MITLEHGIKMLTLREFADMVELDADIVDINVWDENEWDYVDSIGFCDYSCFGDCVFHSEELKPYLDCAVKDISCGVMYGKSHVLVEIENIVKGDNNNE